MSQRTLGTHRLAEPVSKMTLKGCGGVPMPMVPWKEDLRKAGEKAPSGSRSEMESVAATIRWRRFSSVLRHL